MPRSWEAAFRQSLFTVPWKVGTDYLNNTKIADETAPELSLLHKKHLNYLVSELKPALAEIITQGISCGEIAFDYPEALAEIALLVIAVKLDNFIIP